MPAPTYTTQFVVSDVVGFLERQTYFAKYSRLLKNGDLMPRACYTNGSCKTTEPSADDPNV